MAYVPINWIDLVTKLGPTNLNHIEQGIVTADVNATAAVAAAAAAQADADAADAAAVAAQATANAAIEKALLTTAGDTIYASAASTPARRAIGANGNVMTVVAGLPAWTAPAATGGMILIEDYTVAGAVLAAYDTNIRFGVGLLSQAYKSLVLDVTARGDSASSAMTLSMRLNGDTGANYDQQTLEVTGASPAGAESLGRTDITVLGRCSANLAPAGVASNTRIELPHYTGTVFQKVAKMIESGKRGTAASDLNNTMRTGYWRNTAAINRIVVTPSGGNFLIGSRFTLWGLT